MGGIPPYCGAPQYERSSNGMAVAHRPNEGPSAGRWGQLPRAAGAKSRPAEVVILVEGSCCKGSPKPLRCEGSAFIAPEARRHSGKMMALSDSR